MNVAEMTTKQILDHYNTIATRVGLKVVKKFADRKTAERRLNKLIDEHGTESAPSVEPTESTPATEPTRRVARRVGFNFPPKYQVPRKVREGSLRERAIKMLSQGATLMDIQNLCDLYHMEKGITPRNVERRAYELVRLINHYVGYGLREEGDKIYVYTNQQALPLEDTKDIDPTEEAE